MRQLDEQVLTSKFPKIPSLIITIRKGDEIEIFDNFKQLKNWLLEVFPNELKSSYGSTQRSYNGMDYDVEEYLGNFMRSEFVDFLADNGWEMKVSKE